MLKFFVPRLRSIRWNRINVVAAEIGAGKRKKRNKEVRALAEIT